ncbi:uncharacterized protein BXZ73DRAFT_98706 [Epithele typhae]|uniref:uncharacterized protein n=1 Tax=Epithele typhae TaxID=378194 RepID=UPI00200722D8|nr:uncharacterized protein BXZ73DRAFT_98706 [Epithele typhae]KAH9940874.1 hypothetical protein BXZ73DRAFT_98706 [Epithele typhae]
MPRAAARAGSDDESGYEEPTASKKGASAKTNGHDDEPEAGDGSEGGSGDEEEYEIERILESKMGVFPEGRKGYLVKWKGYDDTHNSWVDERDAEGASDLIKAFWEREGAKKKAKGKPAPKPRKSVAASDSEEEAPPAKKRGRPPKSASRRRGGRREMETTTTRTQEAAAQKKTAAAVVDDDSDEGSYADMKKLFKSAPSWEPHVEKVDTVERTNDGNLVVYFTLKHSMGHGRESSTICKDKMPRKLIEFYEGNLRWKPAEEDAMDQD